MQWIGYLAGPAVGGVIGYITNALAIRMLFRPYTAKHIGRWRVPFTPGIIPKEKGRIAGALGQAISDNLMNREVLEKYLLADDMVEKVRQAVAGYVRTQQENEETLRQFAGHFLSAEEVGQAIAGAKRDLTAQVSQRLANAKLGDKIAGIVVDRVVEKMSLEGLNIPLKGVVSAILGAPLWKAVGNALRGPATSFLAKNIDGMLSEHADEMVASMLDKGVDELADTPVKQLLAGKEAELGQMVDASVGLYKRLISEQLPKILATIDIPRIIEGRINEMDMAETERLIFAVMDKELKAIIWLGAGLGFLMGFVNTFVGF